MNAIYKDELYYIVECESEDLLLSPFGDNDNEQLIRVPYGDRKLVVDPTDDEYFECRNRMALRKTD